MAPRTVENPFKKERRIKWAHYVMGGIGCLVVLVLIFGGSSPSSSTMQSMLERQNQQQPRRANIRYTNNKVELTIGIDNSKEEQADDQVEEEDDEDEAEEATQGTDDGTKNEEINGKSIGGEDEEDNEDDDDQEFPQLTLAEYPKWLRCYHKKLQFEKHPDKHGNKLTRQILQQSLVLGCDNIANNQKEAGNFNYQYNFVTKEMDTDDNAVRQAGALWGMTLCFQSQPSNKRWQAAVEKGMDFFQTLMVDGPAQGSRVIRYPGSASTESGTNAIYGLALIDYIRTIRDNNVIVNLDKAHDIDVQLASTVQFLKYMQNGDLFFADRYYFVSKRKSDNSSPYYDGETMLCLIKAARYIAGFTSLIPLIEETVPVLVKEYSLNEWIEDHDSDQTKGFYQWSSMFCTEYYMAKWKNYEVFGDYVIVLAHWIIHTHNILRKNRNTGYAYEGIISAYDIAKTRGHTEALEDLSYTIDEGLYELGRWQVGGPLAKKNSFLVSNPTDEKIAVGGVMNAVDESPLRIDTTQHQMHAVMMAMASVYIK